MKSPTRTLTAVVAASCVAALCAGCALTPEQTAEAKTEKQYRTGSNLPVRDGPSDVRAYDPQGLQGPRPTLGPYGGKKN